MDLSTSFFIDPFACPLLCRHTCKHTRKRVHTSHFPAPSCTQSIMTATFHHEPFRPNIIESYPLAPPKVHNFPMNSYRPTPGFEKEEGIEVLTKPSPVFLLQSCASAARLVPLLLSCWIHFSKISNEHDFNIQSYQKSRNP